MKNMKNMKNTSVSPITQAIESFKPTKNKTFKNMPIVTKEIAQQVWMLSNVEDKKIVLLDYIGESCNTDAHMKIRVNIKNARTANKVDEIVTNLVLAAEGLKA